MTWSDVKVPKYTEGNNEDLAEFLAIESETQKEVLKEDAFEAEDIALDNSSQHPYFIQNLLNVINNRKVCQTTQLTSCERTSESQNGETVNQGSGKYSSIRIDQKPKFHNLK